MSHSSTWLMEGRKKEATGSLPHLNSLRIFFFVSALKYL